MKSKGINHNHLITKILTGNKKTLNAIYRKHILRERIRSKDKYKDSIDQTYFKHIFKDKYFRNNLLLVDKTDLLRREIDKILRNRCNNNKSNIIFQDFIEYISDLLLSSNNTHLCVDLYFFVKDNYKVDREVNIINETRKAGKYTLNKLKLINELIDHIDYINFLNNDIDKFQILRMNLNHKNLINRLQKLNICFLTNPFKLVRIHQKHTSILNKVFTNLWRINDKSFNIDGYINDFNNAIESFVNTDKDLKEIYMQLTINKGKIETKLLYNQLIKLKDDLRETLNKINYGIDYSDDSKIEEFGNIYYKGAMPFHESGKLQLSDKQFRQLNINTLYFRKSNQKSIRNLKKGKFNNQRIDGQIKIIDEGVNRYNRKQYKKSYFIHYQYITTTKQQKQFKALMYKLKRSIINNRKHFKILNFNDYVNCTYNFPYLNKQKNFNAFKEYYKEITHLNNKIYFSNIYPYATSDLRMKNKFLNSTSFNNNIWRDYLMRTHINRNLANIIYRLDFNRKITDFYDPKKQIRFTRRKLRLFLSNIITKINKDNNLTKLFNEFLTDLIKEYNNRLYLFQIYGIDALKKQVLDLQQFHDSFKAKRNLKAIRCKHLIKKLKNQIPLRKQHLDFIMMQKFTIMKFAEIKQKTNGGDLISLFKGASNLGKNINKHYFNPHNTLIQSILNDNIEKYTSKSLVRKIQTSRTKVECIQMACNNLNSIKINYLESMPVYVKETNEEFNKLDELLDNSDSYKVEYVDQERSIDVIQLFKCIIKFDRFLNLNDLYDSILNLKINEFETLKQYIYKEKHILNQF